MKDRLATASSSAAGALFLSIVFGVAGQLLMKAAALRTVGSAIDPSLAIAIVGALLVYSLGVVNWIFALRQLDLSIAYPLTALSYAGILGGSYYWFGERLSTARLIGVALIFAGVMLVALCSADSGAVAVPSRSVRE